MTTHQNTTSIDSQLLFAADNDPKQGFTNPASERDKVSDDTVVRELVQNCLDSGAKNVRFALRPVTALHGLDEYQDAFGSAKQWLGPSEPENGTQIIDRIDEALAALRSGGIPCLVCCDDGDGLDAGALRALYGSGRSTKGSTGRGSVGNGHLTAFAASKLRYVMYASRRADGHGAFGGHAITASHKDRNGDQRSPHGYIRKVADGNAVHRTFDEETGGSVLPDCIRKLTDGLLGPTGTAVVVTAYDPREQYTKHVSTADAVLGSAAHNFAVAVHDGLMEAAFEENGSIETLDRGSLSTRLSSLTAAVPKKRALRTHRTLASGRMIPAAEAKERLGRGVRIWLRPRLDTAETQRPRVSIFRDGMWIEDNVVGYHQPMHFGGTRPFDAVVDLSSSSPGSFGELVRAAEGVSHTQIVPKEITDRERRDELTGKLRALRELISDHAEKISGDADHVSDKLRLLGSSAASHMRRRPKRSPTDGSDLEGEDGRSEGNEEGAGGGGGGAAVQCKTDDRVAAGDTDGIAVTCRPEKDPNGTRGYRMRFESSEELAFGGLVEVVLPAGTDQTSQSRIRPERLRIDKAWIGGTPCAVDKLGRACILGPVSSGDLRVLLDRSSPVSDKDWSLSTIVVSRRKPNKDTAQ